MYKFFFNLWVSDRISKERLEKAVTKGFITTSEKEEILETPQIEQ